MRMGIGGGRDGVCTTEIWQDLCVEGIAAACERQLVNVCGLVR